MAKLKVVLQEQLKLCRHSQLLRDIKAFVVFFNDTLRHYGLDVAPLVAVVHEMRLFYVELAQRDSSDVFDNLLEHDSGAPLTLHSEQEVAELGTRHALVPRHVSLPLNADYSALVPHALDAVLDSVSDVRQFSADLPGAATQVWRAADRLVATLARRVAEYATNAATARSIAARVQLLCDLYCIAAALPALEQRIARFADVAAGAFDDEMLEAATSAPLTDAEYEIALSAGPDVVAAVCGTKSADIIMHSNS